MTILIHPTLIERAGLNAVLALAKSQGCYAVTGHGRGYLKLWRAPYRRNHA